MPAPRAKEHSGLVARVVIVIGPWRPLITGEHVVLWRLRGIRKEGATADARGPYPTPAES